jgi:murein DD-endopeptidase MepM/ murein hydrolase activator NlpD
MVLMWRRNTPMTGYAVRRHAARPRHSTRLPQAVAWATALACVAALVLAPTSSADTNDQKKQVDAQVQALQAALEGTSTDLANAYIALQQTQAQIPAAQATLVAAQAQAKAASDHNDVVAAQLAVAEANEARARDQLAQNSAAVDSTQHTLDLFAADLFQSGSSSQLEVALGAMSPDDFATRIVMADTVTSLTNSALDNLQAARADSSANQSYLSAVQVEVADLKRQAEASLAAANSARDAAAAAKAALDALSAQQAAYAATVEAQKANEQAQLNAAEAEQAQLQAMLVEEAKKAAAAEAARQAAETAKAAAARAAGKPYTPPRADANPGSGGFLSSPANGPITSPFGLRYHPILHVWKLHTGTDFGIPCGTPVYAAANGRVISAGWGGGDGNRLVIDTGIHRGVDLAITYNHLSSFVVTSGTVTRGQLVAYSGTTGYSTGCHLHFETLENGQFVDPMTWL